MKFFHSLTINMSLLLLMLGMAVSSGDWGYDKGEHDPSHWAEHYPICGGSHQSPINIVTSDAVTDPDLDAISMKYRKKTGMKAGLINNGHTVVVEHLGGGYEIQGGELPGVFELAQFHFHWGSDDSKGSEHQINGNAYPMELHLVHWNDKYASFDDAVDKPDGLAVLAFLFEVDSAHDDNEAFDVVTESLLNVVFKGTETPLKPFSIRDLLPKKLSCYYRYAGSLTTPPCYESVTWTVFKETIPISENQMNHYRALFEEGSYLANQLADNFRPVQDLNDRVVYASAGLDRNNNSD